MRQTGALNTQMNVAPLLGVLLALTAVVIAVGSRQSSFEMLDFPPAVPGYPVADAREPSTVDVAASGVVRLRHHDRGDRFTTLERLSTDASDWFAGDSLIFVRANNADVPYGRFAEAMTTLEAAGFEVGLISEDIS